MPLGLSTMATLLALSAVALPFATAKPGNETSAIVHDVNIFSADGSDPRQVQPHAGADRAFAPIGRIFTNQRVPDPDPGLAASSAGQPRGVNLDGTAFLVSPCYALTDYHVVFGGGRTPGPEYTATFYTFDGDGASMSGTLAIPVLWGPMARVWQPKNDWVLLKLRDCVGGRIGWMALDNDDRQDPLGRQVTSVGFAADKDPSSLWSDNCHLLHASGGSFLDDCAITDGSSGSPIVVLTSDGPEVVALTQGELNQSVEILPDYVSQRANIASDVHAFPSSVPSLIQADIAAFGRPNPAIAPSD